MQLKISSVKWRPFCPGGDELSDEPLNIHHPHLANSVHADGPAPDGARPEADTVLTTNLNTFSMVNNDFK